MENKTPVTYELSSSPLKINEEIITTYGIQCKNGDRVTQKINDVSTNKESVSTLVRACNDLRLDPVLLSDVVENFIENI